MGIDSLNSFLVKLSDLLQTTLHQLSYIINNGFKEHFFEFINKYRIETAKELLQSEDKTICRF